MAKFGEALRYLRDVVEHVRLTQDKECKPWPYGKSSRGYGQVYYKRRTVGAHRLSLHLYDGSDNLNASLLCLHAPKVCHDPSCINPLHLRWGNSQDNHADQLLDGTSVDGENNPSAVLTPEQVIAIRKDNRDLMVVANEYGVSHGHINKIRKRRAWARLGDC